KLFLIGRFCIKLLFCFIRFINQHHFTVRLTFSYIKYATIINKHIERGLCMRIQNKHYINGSWIASTGDDVIDVINTATEKTVGTISNGTAEDVNRAVQAAKEAFVTFSQTTVEERIDLLNRIASEYEKRKQDFITVITEELGSPLYMSENSHYTMGLFHFKQAAKELEKFQFEERRGN